MRSKEQSRWDVSLPDKGRAEAEGKLKTLLSGLVLLALVTAPILVSNGKESESSGLGPETGGEPVAQAAAFTRDGEAGGIAEGGKDKEDSTGVKYGRYFPGRQAM